MARLGTPRRPRVDVAALVASGRSCIEAGRYADAVDVLLAAAELSPSDAEVLNDLGVAYLALRRIADAMVSFRRSIASQPNVANTHYNLGLALQHAGDDEAAIAEYRRAVGLHPGLAAAHAQLGDLLSESGGRGEAIAAYRSAHAAAPETTVGRLSVAKALMAENRDREAEETLRTLATIDPSSAMAHVLLGRILLETGRFDEARSSFARATAVDPWQANAYHGLVSSTRITEADRPWVAWLLSRLEAGELYRRFAPSVAERHRMLLHFALGKALDDLGDYPAAMDHFRAANAIRRTLCPFDRDEVERCVDRIIARFTPALFSEQAALGSDEALPVLIVGMPRSGTTLLERVISSHPAVHGCGELAFWMERGPMWLDADVEKLASAAGALQKRYLRALRRGAADALRATDKMPFNFFWVGLVHLLFPNARILHARRDPVDTCLSIYTTAFTADWGFTSTLDDLVWYYRQYRRVMAHWRSVLPPDRLLDVDYEDLVAQQEATSRRLMAFVGVEWDPACLRPHENPQVVKTASSWQARQPLYRTSVERWRNYEPWIATLLDLR